MGLSFLGLLYLQVSYIEAMVKMRKEQFDNSVRNSLYQVSKDVEFAETDRWLREDISEAERKALTASSTIQGEDLVQQTQRFTVKSPDGRIMTDFELKVMTNKPSELPKMMISRIYEFYISHIPYQSCGKRTGRNSEILCKDVSVFVFQVVLPRLRRKQ